MKKENTNEIKMKLSTSHDYTRFIFILANHNWNKVIQDNCDKEADTVWNTLLTSFCPLVAYLTEFVGDSSDISSYLHKFTKTSVEEANCLGSVLVLQIVAEIPEQKVVHWLESTAMLNFFQALMRIVIIFFFKFLHFRVGVGVKVVVSVKTFSNMIKHHIICCSSTSCK